MYKALSRYQASVIADWLGKVEDAKIYTWAAAFGHPVTASDRILEVPKPLTEDLIAVRLFEDLRTLLVAEQSKRIGYAKARQQADEWGNLARQMYDEKPPATLIGVWGTILDGMIPKQ